MAGEGAAPPPMALGDKKNKLYLSNKKIDMSSHCEREGKVHIDLIRKGKRTTIQMDKLKKKTGGGPWRSETRETDCM